jgi:hypothetical protein
MSLGSLRAAAGAPRHPNELTARTQRLGVELLAPPARLVAIGLCTDGAQSDEALGSGLHLSLSRSAAALRPGTAVVVDEDLIEVPKRSQAIGKISSAGC